MKALCKVKAATHRRSHIVWSHLYEMPRIANLWRQEVDEWLPRAEKVEEIEKSLLMCNGFFVGGQKSKIGLL